MEKLTDIVGKAIEAGCMIAYPVRKGSQMWLKHLQVSRVDELNRTVHGTNSLGTPITIKNIETVAVLSA